ncbi:hypothetical protein HYS94_05185 [Candidatus Daviesbacteria bacterium]|nr:hypothetical protein [Candidatus Daviesbacteria bacterium]
MGAEMKVEGGWLLRRGGFGLQENIPHDGIIIPSGEAVNAGPVRGFEFCVISYPSHTEVVRSLGRLRYRVECTGDVKRKRVRRGKIVMYTLNGSDTVLQIKRGRGRLMVTNLPEELVDS